MSKIKSFRVGELRDFAQVTTAFSEISSTLSQLLAQAIATTDGPPVAGTLYIPVMDSTGTVTLWKLVAGSGVTITPNTTTKTLTFTSP